MSGYWERETVAIPVLVVATTELAVLFRYDTIEEWVPRSQLIGYNEMFRGSWGEVEMTRWIAEKVGFI